jgi:hypothetical protein
LKAEQSAEAVEIQKAIALANSRVRAGDDLDDYMCPLTLGLFVDPVLDSLGHTYERKAIDDWLNGHTTSPKTNEELPDKLLRPNRVMKAAVEAIRSLLDAKNGRDAKPAAAKSRTVDARPPVDDYGSDEIERDCPLCCEPFDETDLVFKACPCDYKVCLYCFHHIKDRGDKKCPACRADYGDGEMGAKRLVEKQSSREREKANATVRGRAPSPVNLPQEAAPSLADLDMMADDRTYRTKICKRWQDGHCSYGASCWFAHGKDQLRALNTAGGRSNPSDLAAKAAAQRPAVQQAVQHATNAAIAAAKVAEELAASDRERQAATRLSQAAPVQFVRQHAAKPFPFELQVRSQTI